MANMVDKNDYRFYEIHSPIKNTYTLQIYENKIRVIKPYSSPIIGYWYIFTEDKEECINAEIIIVNEDHFIVEYGQNDKKGFFAKVSGLTIVFTLGFSLALI